jgi:hypothetical protein
LSYQEYLKKKLASNKQKTLKGSLFLLAGWTGLEPAAFRVTGGRSNQLNYHPLSAHTSLTASSSGSLGLSLRRAISLAKVLVFAKAGSKPKDLMLIIADLLL